METIEIKLEGKDYNSPEIKQKDEIVGEISQSDEIGANILIAENSDVEFDAQINVISNVRKHKDLLGLDYESSGHKGFASEEELNQVKTTPARPNLLGMVKVGERLSILDDGTLSVDVANEVEDGNNNPVTSNAVYRSVSLLEEKVVPKRLSLLPELSSNVDRKQVALYADYENKSYKVTMDKIGTQIKTVKNEPVDMQVGDYIFLEKGD